MPPGQSQQRGDSKTESGDQPVRPRSDEERQPTETRNNGRKRKRPPWPGHASSGCRSDEEREQLARVAAQSSYAKRRCVRGPRIVAARAPAADAAKGTRTGSRVIEPSLLPASATRLVGRLVFAAADLRLVVVVGSGIAGADGPWHGRSPLREVQRALFGIVPFPVAWKMPQCPAPECFCPGGRTTSATSRSR